MFILVTLTVPARVTECFFSPFVIYTYKFVSFVPSIYTLSIFNMESIL